MQKCTDLYFGFTDNSVAWLETLFSGWTSVVETFVVLLFSIEFFSWSVFSSATTCSNNKCKSKRSWNHFCNKICNKVFHSHQNKILLETRIKAKLLDLWTKGQTKQFISHYNLGGSSKQPTCNVLIAFFHQVSESYFSLCQRSANF